MADNQQLVTGSKAEQYAGVLQQLDSLISPNDHWVSSMANMAALLKHQFEWLWVGFYLVKSPQSMILGPFQGPLACTEIAYNQGVCGKSWAQRRSLVVPNVHEFSGHIACSSLSNSEIVVPIFNQDTVVAVLDVDSTRFGDFDQTDQFFLEKMVLSLQIPLTIF